MIYDFAKRENDESFWCPTKFSKNPKCKEEKTKLEDDWTAILPIADLIAMRKIREEKQKLKVKEENSIRKKYDEEAKSKKER